MKVMGWMWMVVLAVASGRLLYGEWLGGRLTPALGALAASVFVLGVFAGARLSVWALRGRA